MMLIYRIQKKLGTVDSISTVAPKTARRVANGHDAKEAKSIGKAGASTGRRAPGKAGRFSTLKIHCKTELDRSLRKSPCHGTPMQRMRHDMYYCPADGCKNEYRMDGMNPILMERGDE